MIDGYLSQTATITHTTSTDADGERTLGAPVSTACRFSPQTRQVLLPDGSLTLQRGIAYLPAATVLAPTDTLTINGVDYTPIAINSYPGLDGTTVYLKVSLA